MSLDFNVSRPGRRPGHDPLCPDRYASDYAVVVWPAQCACRLISQVRADERETIARTIEHPEDDCWFCGKAWKGEPCADESGLTVLAHYIRQAES